MQKLLVSAELHSILPTLATAVLLVDDSGKLVGSFTPASLMRPPITKEELERRKTVTGKSVTTAELLQMLERS